MRPYIDLIGVNICLYVYCYSSNYAIPYHFFVYISSSNTAYKNVFLLSIFCESHLLINHISSMARIVTSGTTGE